MACIRVRFIGLLVRRGMLRGKIIVPFCSPNDLLSFVVVSGLTDLWK